MDTIQVGKFEPDRFCGTCTGILIVFLLTIGKNVTNSKQGTIFILIIVGNVIFVIFTFLNYVIRGKGKSILVDVNLVRCSIYRMKCKVKN